MELTIEEQHRLLQVARQAIENRLHNGRASVTPPKEAALQRHSGCFVTLKERGQLRGCIGIFSSAQPLWHSVAEMAVAAATGDPRFPPLSAAELSDIRIEISVLSPLQVIAAVEEIEVGRHGIYLEMGPRRGVLLPQVASEYGWDRTTFLQQTCRKAGLPADAWQNEATRISIFSAEIFGEEE